MRLSSLLLATAACSLLSSCFKDEPLNAECDIEEAWVHVDNPDDVFYNPTDTLIEVRSSSNKITFTKKLKANVALMAPTFKLTEGATIVPENGSMQDFSNERQVQYTVTSQDGAWSRTYYVMFSPPKIPLNYDFEQYSLYVEPQYGIIKYYTWQEIYDDGSVLDIWATGNPGFAIARGNALPEDYPTVPMPGGLDRSAVKLETRSTEKWGIRNKKPIAAGNLFLGTFDENKAIVGDGLQSTNFGIPFNKEPVKMKGYYKYHPGTTYTNKENEIIDNRQDSAAIYSVLYRNHDDEGNEVMLHGDDVMTNPNIVAIARLWDVKYTDDWTAFDINFAYSKELDRKLLEDFGYNIAVVFSSSKEGAHFEGAVGSTLCIDKVSIECIENEETITGKDTEQ